MALVHLMFRLNGYPKIYHYHQRFLDMNKNVFIRNFKSKIHVKNNETKIKHKQISRGDPTSTKERIFEKITTPKLSVSSLRKLYDLVKHEKGSIIAGVCFLVLSSSITMSIPLIMGKVLDVVQTPNTKITIASYNVYPGFDTSELLCFIGVILIIGAACNYGRIKTLSRANHRMTQSLKSRIFNSMLEQEQAFFDNRTTGSLLSRLTSDSQAVTNSMSQNISDGLRSTITVLGSMGFMMYTSPILASVAGAGLVTTLGSAIMSGITMRATSRQLQSRLATAGEIAEEKISNIRTVKMFGTEIKEMKNYSLALNNVLKLGYKEADQRALFYGIAGLAGNVMLISVIYFGTSLVASGQLSMGDLTAFVMYAAYFGLSLSGLATFYGELNKSIGAADRLLEIMDRQSEIPIHGGIVPKDELKGCIHFDIKHFWYPLRADNLTTINDVDLRIAPGETVAIVGPSGCGKSTLVSLLLKLYKPNEGSIYVDKMDIHSLNSTWLKHQIGIVNQEPPLFHGTIASNILYGVPDPTKITNRDFEQAVQDANVHNFVSNLDGKYHTEVGENGYMLSAGEKQRVAIARALIKKPKILILDEATSALDTNNEALVQDALKKAMNNRTVIIIAHRLSTIEKADKIVVMNKGKIVEQGTYPELANNPNSLFSGMLKRQTNADSYTSNN